MLPVDALRSHLPSSPLSSSPVAPKLLEPLSRYPSWYCYCCQLYLYYRDPLCFYQPLYLTLASLAFVSVPFHIFTIAFTFTVISYNAFYGNITLSIESPKFNCSSLLLHPAGTILSLVHVYCFVLFSYYKIQLLNPSPAPCRYDTRILAIIAIVFMVANLPS